MAGCSRVINWKLAYKNDFDEILQLHLFRVKEKAIDFGKTHLGEGVNDLTYVVIITHSICGHLNKCSDESTISECPRNASFPEQRLLDIKEIIKNVECPYPIINVKRLKKKVQGENG